MRIADAGLVSIHLEGFEHLGFLQTQRRVDVVLRVILQHLVSRPDRILRLPISPVLYFVAIEHAVVAGLHAVVDTMNALLKAGNGFRDPGGLDLVTDLVIQQLILVQIFGGF
ncbi:hypothetical protein D3C77_193850 [compost metagenome]